MINFMVANANKKDKRYTIEKITTLLSAQIENSIEMGWNQCDIMILSNFDFEFMQVKTLRIDLNKHCYTGSKMFGLYDFMMHGAIFEGEVVWSHDLDCWQNVPFSTPDFKDVGIAQYSNKKFNGGSVFWKDSSKDIVLEIIEALKEEEREEPTLNRVLKSDKYKDRVTVLNNTYNVGCSGFVKRYERSIKPIRVCHFHPYNRIAWETHALDRNGIGEVAVTIRLERLLRKYYPNLQVEITSK